MAKKRKEKQSLGMILLKGSFIALILLVIAILLFDIGVIDLLGL